MRVETIQKSFQMHKKIRPAIILKENEDPLRIRNSVNKSHDDNPFRESFEMERLKN